MDFELLSESPQKPLTLLQLLERLLSNRRRQWQIWAEKPPYTLSVVILLMVSLEMTLGRRLVLNLGGGTELLTQLNGTILFFLISETFFVFLAAKGAHMVGKDGNFLAGLTYLNLSLAPLLLILPISVLAWATGNENISFFRSLLIFALGLKVISLWKHAVEHVYKLTSVQSALVLYASVGLTVVVASLFVYIGLVRSVANIISG